MAKNKRGGGLLDSGAPVRGRFDAFELACLAILVVCMVLRFVRLGESLWLDEVMSVLDVRRGLLDVIRDVRQASPPLFYVFLYVWRGLFGDSEFALRLLPACLGCLGVLTLWKVGDDMFGRPSGLVSAALLAAHPLHFAHSQDLKPYALLVLLTTLSVHFLVKALREDQPRDWLLFAAATLGNLYTHNYALFLLGAEGVWIIIERLKRPQFLSKAMAAALAIITIGYAPWIPFLRAQAALGMSSYLPLAGSGLFLSTIYCFSGIWITAGAMSLSLPIALAGPLLIVWILVVGLSLWLSITSRPRYYFLPLIAFLTLLVPFLLSFREPIYHAGRHTIIVLPLLCLFFAVSLQVGTRGWARAGILAALFFTYAFTLRGYFSTAKAYDRDIAHYIRSQDRPDYALLIFPKFRKIPVAYYYPEAERALTSLRDSSLPRPPEGVILMEVWGKSVDAWHQGLFQSLYEPVAQRQFGHFARITVFHLKPRA